MGKKRHYSKKYSTKHGWRRRRQLNAAERRDSEVNEGSWGKMPMRDRKLYDKLRREKIKNDRELLKYWRDQRHEHYLKRKEQGKIKLATDMSEREKRKQRQKWRETSRTYRERKRAKQVNGDDPLVDEPLQTTSLASENRQEIVYLSPVNRQSSPVVLENKESSVLVDKRTKEIESRINHLVRRGMRVPIASTSFAESPVKAESDEMERHQTFSSYSLEIDRNVQPVIPIACTCIKVEGDEKVLYGTCTCTSYSKEMGQSGLPLLVHTASNSSTECTEPIILSTVKDESDEEVPDQTCKRISFPEGTEQYGQYMVAPTTSRIKFEKISSSIKHESDQQVLHQTPYTGKTGRDGQSVMAASASSNNTSPSRIFSVVKAESEEKVFQRNHMMTPTASTSSTILECIVSAVKIESNDPILRETCTSTPSTGEIDRNGQPVIVTSSTTSIKAPERIKAEIDKKVYYGDGLLVNTNTETKSLPSVIEENEKLKAQSAELKNKFANQRNPEVRNEQSMMVLPGSHSTTRSARRTTSAEEAQCDKKEMSPSREKKKKNRLWSPTRMREAIDAMRVQGIGANKASQLFSIPRTTLRRQSRKKSCNPTEAAYEETSSKSCLPVELEEELVRSCVEMEKAFITLTRSDLKKLAFELAIKNNIPNHFNPNDGKIGRRWVNQFLRRHKNRLFKHGTSHARLGGFTKGNVGLFFDRLESIFAKHNFPRKRQFSVQESGLAILQGSEGGCSVIRLRGERQVRSLSVADKGTLIKMIVVCMSAAGDFVPPLVTFPREKISEALMEGAPPGTVFRTDSTDWIQSSIFTYWFHHFIYHTQPTQKDPVLLILDGSHSYIRNMDFFDLARKNFVTIISLPTRSAHKMHPVDKAFSSALRIYYPEEIRQFALRKKSPLINQDIMAPFGRAYLKCRTAAIAMYGFEACGICPMDRNKFDDSEFVAETRRGETMIDDNDRIDDPDPLSLLPQEENLLEPNETYCAAGQSYLSKHSPIRPSSFDKLEKLVSPSTIKYLPKLVCPSLLNYKGNLEKYVGLPMNVSMYYP